MKESKIEEKLRDAAKNINPGEFSEILPVVKQKMDEKQAEKQMNVIPELVPAAVSAGGNNSRNTSGLRRKWLLVAGAAIILCGIILILVFVVFHQGENNFTHSGGVSDNGNASDDNDASTGSSTGATSNNDYFTVSDLYAREVTEEQFYDGLNTAGIVINDLSDYDIQFYNLYYVRDDIVKGGFVDIVSESYLLTINFYASDVNVNVVFDNGYAVYNGVVDVSYYTEYADDFYNTIGQANYCGVTYVIEYTSLYDDVISLFDSIFT